MVAYVCKFGTEIDFNYRNNKKTSMTLAQRLSKRRIGSGGHVPKKTYQQAGLFSDTYKGLT